MCVCQVKARLICPACVSQHTHSEHSRKSQKSPTWYTKSPYWCKRNLPSSPAWPGGRTSAFTVSRVPIESSWIPLTHSLTLPHKFKRTLWSNSLPPLCVIKAKPLAGCLSVFPVSWLSALPSLGCFSNHVTFCLWPLRIKLWCYKRCYKCPVINVPTNVIVHELIQKIYTLL